jgi:hypothetical protein
MGSITAVSNGGYVLRILHIIPALALSLVFFTGSVAADPLMRSNCWTWNDGVDGFRTLCFAGSGRVEMRNRSQKLDKTGLTTCQWSGKYAQTGTKVTAAFAPGSGKCSNDVPSPQYSVTCNFPGDRLDCRSSSLVGGQLLEFDRTFK